MKRLFRIFDNLPLAIKVPVSVAVLTVVVAVVISQVVLSRLADEQEASLRSLATAFMDGVSTAVTPGLLRQDVWETFDSLDRARRQYGSVKTLFVVVLQPNGQVLAASEPEQFPVSSSLPQNLAPLVKIARPLTLDEEKGRAWAVRPIDQENFRIGTVLAELDISEILAVRNEVLWTLILVNAGLAAIFSLAGYVLVRRMVSPLSVIQQHLTAATTGRPEMISEREFARAPAEYGELYHRFNAMIRGQAEREALAAELANQEKMAMLGRLASGMAHEVNNPLGGLMNAVDTLDVHGDKESVRRRTIDLLKRGLAGIQNVVRAALVTYKAPAGLGLTKVDLDDLPFLIQHEIGAKQINLEWRNEIEAVIPVDASAVRQIALNLLLNACAASPQSGTIKFYAAATQDQFTLVVEDEGPGLPDAAHQAVTIGASGANAPDGRGLGLWTVGRLAARLDAKMTLQSGPSQGAVIELTVPLGEEREEVHVATRAHRVG